MTSHEIVNQQPDITLLNDDQAESIDGFLTIYARINELHDNTPTFATDFTKFRDGIWTF